MFRASRGSKSRLNAGMRKKLKIPSQGRFDLVALGALVHRLDPGVVPFRKARTCDIHVSGAEFNVAANLADCFRLRTAIVTAMVDYPIGDRIAEEIQARGVTPFYRRFAHDGVTGPNMATVYSDRGYGVRGPVVFYNRANEAAARLGPGDIDWADIFSSGVRWFHSGGLFASLSESTGELIVEATRAARLAGAIVSFDLNYREKLWRVWGGQEVAMSVFRRIVENVDVLVGNEEDLQKALGIAGPNVEGPHDFNEEAFAAMAEEALESFPQLEVIATSLRDVRSSNRHRWSAAVWAGGEVHVAPTVELDVFDRVGGGDGFASGLFYGLLSGEPPAEALKLGWAHGALLTTFPGDTTMASLDQVRALAAGSSARVQR